jgi:FHA domain-containing protein
MTTALRDVGATVIGLRLWGLDTIHDLPPSSAPLLVGTSSACAIRLDGQNTAAEHANLTFDGEQWWIRNLGTPDGVRQDGVPSSGFVLTPGVEIGVGGATLVAESEHTGRLRAFCQRLLGWGGRRMRSVDHALRAIRLANAHRTPLVLRGEGDLVPIAYALHRFTIGSSAPFIVCDRRRHDTLASVRSPPNVPRGIEAFTRAVGGTLCIRHARLPADIDKVMRRAYEPDSEVQLIVCDRSRRRAASLGGVPAIEIPLLQLREMELSRIVQEYAEDARTTLEVGPDHFNDDDRDWVIAHCAQSMPEIEKATLRIVALSASQSCTQAAARLGMAPVSLARWIDRRRRRATNLRSAELIGDQMTGRAVRRARRSVGDLR